MDAQLAGLAGEAQLGSFPVLGILIALIGALFLSLGAQFQHRGVAKVERMHGSGTQAGLSVGELRRLLARPSWIFGTVMLGTAVAFQLTSLAFAPLIVVQPIGVTALVITAVLNSRLSGARLDRHAIRSVVLCVVSIAVFVSVAAIVAEETPITTQELLVVLAALGVVGLGLAGAFALFRHRAGAVFYIIAAGVLYGFVATLAKVVINRVLSGNFELLTAVCIILLLASTALGAYFVQTAYSLGSPDLVIAGLTVVDPLVAVSIGIVVLGEAAAAAPWAFFVWGATAVVAVLGVFELAKHHPQTRR